MALDDPSTSTAIPPDSPIGERELVAQIEQQVAASIGHWGAGWGISGTGLGSPMTRTSLADQRANALVYYERQPFGNEVEGESQVVSSDVFDTVEGMLPHLLRTFTASDDVVEFEPNGREDEEQAKQQTDVANYVFYRQNNGFLISYEWFKDALIQNNGIVKYWWDTRQTIAKEEYRGLSLEQYEKLLKGEGGSEVEELEHTVVPDETAMEQREEEIKQTIMAMEQEAAQKGVPPEVVEQKRMEIIAASEAVPVPPLHNVKVKITKQVEKVCIETVPPEEFGISTTQKCVSIQNATFCYHRTTKTISDLREMGCPEEVLERAGSAAADDQQLNTTVEVMARERFIDQVVVTPPAPEESQRSLLVTDCYYRVDLDGDGIAELRHIIKVGNAIWTADECDHINFACITPIIMPHTWVGMSAAELVMADQFTKSVILRQMLNNLYLTNNPRKAVLSSASGVVQANLDDLMNTRAGGIMREYVPGAIRNEETPFVAAAAFPMLEYIDRQKETRTSVTPYSQGTDADSLNKMLDIHTEVPMADGSFKVLKDVIDGDLLIGSDGNAVAVLKAHEIQNPEKAYRMVFGSGDEIFAGGEHLWTAMTERDKRSGVSRTVTTDVLYDRTEEFSESMYIPRLQRPRFGGGELPVDPYLLGCWLGDGTSAKSAITTMDLEIVDAFRADGWNMYADKTQNSGSAVTWCIGAMGASLQQDATTGRLVSTGLAWLTKMTQLGVARNKHIPESYLSASYEDRLELLRGLMDTDGCHHSRSLVVFSQKKGRLLADVVRLIEGLGGWPRLSEVDPGDSGKDGQTYWNVTFHLFDNPFRLSRKAIKWISPERNVGTQPIVSIEPVSIRPMRCLTVDAADGLFCVGRRMTLTHNTARGIHLIQQAGQQRIDLIARIFAETGVKDLMRGITYMLSKYSTKAMTVRLRGKWVEVDPRDWKTQFDMRINVGLGTGNKDMQLQHLNAIEMAQIELIKAGRGYLVTDDNIWTLYRKKAEALGFKDPDMFVTDPQTVEKPPPQPNPDLVKIEAEAAESKAKLEQAGQLKLLDAETTREVEQIRSNTAKEIALIDAQSRERIAKAQMDHEAKLKIFEANQPEDGGKAEIAKMQAHIESTLEQERIASAERLALMQQRFEEWKTELQEQTKRDIAELQAQTTLKTAKMAAKAAKEKPKNGNGATA